MLQRRHRGFRQRFRRQPQERRVLGVLNDRNDALLDGAFRRGVVVAFLGAAGPAAGRGIDAEAENAFFLAPAQPLVQPADRRARGIVDTKDRAVCVAREGRRNVERAVAQRPGEDGLNVEALTLALLVIGGDPLGRLGLDIVDPQNIADRVRAAHASAAGVAAFRLVLLVTAPQASQTKSVAVASFPPFSARTPGGSFASWTRKARPS